MNRTNNKIAILLLASFFAGAVHALAQDSTKQELVVNLGYYMTNNKMMYLMVNTKTKIDKKFKPVPNTVVTIYLDSVAATNLVAKVTTDVNGVAKAILPPGLKDSWDASPDHKFLGITAAGKAFDETEVETAVTKSKMAIDTSSDGETRSITATVYALKGAEWVPAADVEMKLGISRLGGILPAGDDPTYTTDSTGSVTVELKKDSLPGDEKGNLILMAKVEENEVYGNLQIDKVVPWGVAVKKDDSFFNQRTLWSTRFRTPFWLLFMAYFIVIGVWGTIIYLVFQLIKIKKLSKEPALE